MGQSRNFLITCIIRLPLAIPFFPERTSGEEHPD
jgi:hypothetical protein